MDFSTLTYKQKRDQAVNSDLIAKLAIAVADAAVTVYTESASVTGHATRAAYATACIKDPESVAKQMAWAAVLLSANDDDSTLKATVLVLWNAFAGVA